MLLLDTINIIRTTRQGGSGAPPFNWLALASFVISGLSLVLSFIGAYRNKKVELVAKRFDKLCIDPVEAGYKELDKLFSSHNGEAASEQRTQIAAKLTEVNLILVSLLAIYPKLNVTSITDANDEFSESYFEAKDEKVEDYLAGYLQTKNTVIHLLYQYILKEELKFRWLSLLPWTD